MPNGESHDEKGQPGVTAAALFGSCPCCRAGGLWAGPAALAERCGSCGLELARHEPRGRAMYLVILPVTVLLVLAALKLDDMVQLPVVALVALWGVVVPLIVTLALRFVKAAALLARLDKEGLI